MDKFTKEETALLIEMLDQLQIKPTAPNAAAIVILIQDILVKIRRLTEQENEDADRP